MRRWEWMTTAVAIEAPVEAPVEVEPDAQLADWAAAARAGDRAALEALLVRVERRVYGFAYRMVGDRTTAEDLAQEALLKVCQRVGQYRGSGSFLGWVYRIVVREVYDWRRRSKHAQKPWCWGRRRCAEGPTP